MATNLLTKKNNARFFSRLNDILYDDVYPALVAAWVLFCYVIDLQAAGLFAMIAVACFIFVFKKDILPVVPLFFYFLYLIKDYSTLLGTGYLIAYGALVVSIVFHFIRFRDKFYAGQLLLPLLLLSLALVLGGNLSIFRNRFINGLTVILTVGPLLIIIYSVFVNGIKLGATPKNFNVKTYIARVAVINGVLLGMQQFLSYYVINTVFAESRILIFWGNSNAFATVIMICIPLCFYLILKTGYIFSWFTVALFLCGAIFRTDSDGCIGISAFLLPFLIVFTYFKIARKYKRRFTVCIVLFIIAVSGITAYLFLTYPTEEIFEYVKTHASSSGRQELYDLAIILFKRHPIFGAGLGFSNDAIYIAEELKLNNFNFHSTIFHTLGTMGVFGALVYCVYYYFRFKIIISENSAYNAYLFFSLTAFTAYGLIDPSEFNVIPILSFLTVLLLVAEKCRFLPADDTLPLSEER